MRITITASTVAKVATWAEEVSSGAFAYNGHGADLGKGARYIDGIDKTVWLGKTGAREAAAYYANGGAKWAELTGQEVPDWAAELIGQLGSPAKVHDAARRGRTDAENRHATGRWAARKRDNK